MGKLHPFNKIRKLVMEKTPANVGWQTPVNVVEGDTPPTKVGHRGGYVKKYLRTMPDGTSKVVEIYYDYHKRGCHWKYKPSTIAIEVGVEWCKEHAPEAVVYFAQKRLGVAA